MDDVDFSTHKLLRNDMETITKLKNEPYDDFSMKYWNFENMDLAKSNLSLRDVDGALLLISQFTLYADCKKGKRPSFFKAGEPHMANDLYEYIIRKCKEEVRDVERGEFGAMMHVELLNEGPFTIILDSAEMGWA